MIKFESGGSLIQEASELPNIPNHIQRLYFDFETSSGHYKIAAVNPWGSHCKAIGVAVAFDDGPVWFVPKHLMTLGWWHDVLRSAHTGIGHNVKFDVHVSANDLLVRPECHLRCTLVGAKLVNSDMVYKGGYGLDVLAKQWLNRDITKYEWAMRPHLDGNKDYGNIPLDILAEYACVDVDVTRALDAYESLHIPEESMDAWRTEQQVTKLLVEIERRGVRVDPIDVQMRHYLVLNDMLELDAKMEKIAGRGFRAHVSGDLYDLLCNQYGLPVVAWTEPSSPEGVPGPSFDKAALKIYASRSDAPTELIEMILEYKELHTFRTLFLDQWPELVDENGLMHANFNQTIRTARMSCSDPNLQQLSGRAKELIIPRPGMAIVCADASQIEYRFIASYCNNERIIRAYQEDPWTDFHQLIADLLGITRKSAKVVNFAISYGQGKKSTLALLSSDKNFVKTVMAGLDSTDKGLVRQMCEMKALAIWRKYHEDLLPELKPTSRRASGACVKQGFVRNLYGRRRHLPAKAAHAAFNTVCQSGAGDMVKERMVALREEVPEFQMIAQVHDEILGEVPLELVERDDALLRRITSVLCVPTRQLKTPMRWSIGWSAKHWLEAKSDERQMKF